MTTTRSGKKIKQLQQQQQQNIDNTPIHSGSFMVTFTEQNEDTYDMPIASPDAANNEVPVAPAKNDNINISKEKNQSLKNLIKYLTTAYSPNITSPKWKNFKGLKLTVKDKIRLNNVIWRTWFQQFGIRDPYKRRKTPICQFSNPLEGDLQSTNKNYHFQEVSTSTNTILEGKYWKRKLDSITNEYKKWREFSRQNLKSSKILNEDDFNTNIVSPANHSHHHHHHHHHQTSSSSTTISKQEHNNRCRSPSPGLFQDLELYNFSDTLFTTIIEDPGDSIIGTYPDLFQPELNPNFRMYPNFDFLDCDFDILNSLNVSSTSHTQSISATPSHQQASSHVQAQPQSSYNQASTQPHLYDQIQPMDYSNFDTLATVAAQSPHLSQQQQQQQFNRQQQASFFNSNNNFSTNHTNQTYHQQTDANANKIKNSQSNTIRDLLAMKTILKSDAFTSNTPLQVPSPPSVGLVVSPKTYQTTSQNDILTYASVPPPPLPQQPTLAPLGTPQKTIRQMDGTSNKSQSQTKKARLPAANTMNGKNQSTINEKPSKSKRQKTSEKLDVTTQPHDSLMQMPLLTSTANDFSTSLMISPATSNSNFSISSNNNENLKSDGKRQSNNVQISQKNIQQMQQKQSFDSSDSVSFKNLSPTNPNSVSNAEQKRRCNIQNGFDQLQTMVPSLKDNQNGKISKAAMLQKTAEYIKELQVQRNAKARDLDQFKHEIDTLSNQISRLQCELPEDGVFISGNFNRTEKFKQKFNSFCQQRISENWRFYPFSLILKPLFDNYTNIVNTSSREAMESSAHEWKNRYCNLSQLRPIVSNALRQLSTKTSILTEPSKLAQECFSAAFNTFT